MGFLAGGEEPEREGLLFIDTETTGLAGGTGTVAFVLGLARMEDDVVHVRQYFLTSFTAEPAMLTQALAWMRGASHLVSFNGKSFDIPLLVTRYRLARIESTLSGCLTSTCCTAPELRSEKTGPTADCKRQSNIC